MTFLPFTVDARDLDPVQRVMVEAGWFAGRTNLPLPPRMPDAYVGGWIYGVHSHLTGLIPADPKAIRLARKRGLDPNGRSFRGVNTIGRPVLQ